MAVHLSVDSGGTKIKVLAYDDDFKPVLRARAGSLRGNTTSKELVQAHLDDLISQLSPIHGERIGLISGIFDGNVLKRIGELCPITQRRYCGEPELGYAAACLEGDAMQALSGTGCTLFARKNGAIMASGGFGSLICDEGSGYRLGKAVLEAAIRDYEDRGPKTMLGELFCQRMGKNDLREAAWELYRRTEQSTVTYIAACSTLLTTAANAGDEVAKTILKDGAKDVADQILALHRKAKMPADCPFTISGGSWRGHILYYQTFKELVQKALPQAQFVLPKADPIVGAVFLHASQVHGWSLEQTAEKIGSYYQEEAFFLP